MWTRQLASCHWPPNWNSAGRPPVPSGCSWATPPCWTARSPWRGASASVRPATAAILRPGSGPPQQRWPRGFLPAWFDCNDNGVGVELQLPVAVGVGGGVLQFPKPNPPCVTFLPDFVPQCAVPVRSIMKVAVLSGAHEAYLPPFFARYLSRRPSGNHRGAMGRGGVLPVVHRPRIGPRAFSCSH